MRTPGDKAVPIFSTLSPRAVPRTKVSRRAEPESDSGVDNRRTVRLIKNEMPVRGQAEFETEHGL